MDVYNLKQKKMNNFRKEWKLERLKDLVDHFISGGTPSTKEPSFWNGSIPWITSAYINSFFVDSGDKSISESGLKNSATNIVPKGNLLIATRVGIGKVAVNLIDIAISQDLTGVIIKKDRVLNDFLCYALLSSKAQSVFKSYVRGSTIKGIARTELEKIKITLPPLPEQKKIAEILSTVDHAIEKVDEAVEKTERLKKGLMQQLFTKGIGHKEYKNTKLGLIPKEWQVIQLDDIAFLERGKFAFRPRNDPRFYNGKYPFIQTGDINDTNGIIEKYSQTLNKEGFKISKLFKKGTIVISIAGNIGDVGILSFDSCFPDSIIGITVDSNKISNLFLMYSLKKLKSKLNSIAPRSTQKNINLEILKPLKILLPPLSEQLMIIQILNTMDKRLELLRKKKERFEKVKKGLMNDLLTGRKRVKMEA